MFTVFGATGHTGSVVVERLLAAGKQVRAVVRDRAKGARLEAMGAQLFVGDVADARLVAEALAGAEGAYLIAPPDLASTDLLGKNRRVIDGYLAGLDAARVPHAVFLSSVGAQHPSGTGPTVFSHHGEVTLAKAKETRLTFVRAPFFMENLLGHAHTMRSDGALPVLGGGEGHPFPMIASRDIGEVAAQALLAPPAATEWIELAGPRDYSFADAAVIASRVLGRAVSTVTIPPDAIVPALTQAGLSASVAELFRELSDAIGRGLMAYEGKGRIVKGRIELAEVLRTGLSGRAPDVEHNKRVVRRVFEEAVNHGRPELLPELFAADYVSPQGDRGPAAFGAVIESLRRAFPDITYVVEDVLAEGDEVAIRWTWTGTHLGAFRTYAPTGRAITNTGMAIHQLRDGRITRIWMENDRLGFQQQLDAAP